MGWTGWSDLGGGFQGGPAAWTLGGVTHVLVRGNDNRVYTRTSADGANFTGWQALPDGVITSAPTLCAVSSTELRVAARGGDGAAWVARYTNGAWQPFKSYGGSLAGEVTMVVTRRRISTVLGPARHQTIVHLFAWSPDGRVLWARDGGATGGVSPFEPIGADIPLAAAPTAYALDDGTIVLVGTSPAGQVWSRSCSPVTGAWGAWQLTYKSVVQGAVRARRIDGSVTLVGAGTNRVAQYWEGGFHYEVARASGTTPVSATPSLDSRAAGQRQLFARSEGGGLIWCRSEGSPFEGLVLVIDAPILPMPGF
jgi:hypothetical protein